MVTTGASAAVASRLLGRTLQGERAITVDQTNQSVIVADEAVVKWLLPPVMTPHPGVELLVHLESRGFGAMPRFLGVEQRDGLVLPRMAGTGSSTTSTHGCGARWRPPT